MNKDGIGRVTFAAPAKLVQAAQKAARQDLSNVSHVCRRALVSELERRGHDLDKYQPQANAAIEGDA